MSASPSEGAGRSCPLHYRYPPSVFAAAAPPALRSAEVLVVVGGLYGNELALHEVLRLFDAESGNKRLVFNGDFHWFDADPAVFDRIQRSVLAHHALRGNVETELAAEQQDAAAEDAGCGCAYPAWFGVTQGAVFIDAIGIEVEAADVQRRFVAQWLPGSDAHHAYFERISRWPAYRLPCALRVDEPPATAARSPGAPCAAQAPGAA